MTMPAWKPFREPLRKTLLRTGTIALVGGFLLARGWAGPAHLAQWPLATLLVLWPALGGHYIEILFLNHLRPRLPAKRSVQVTARLAVWFLGGAALALDMALTALALSPRRPPNWPIWFTVGGAGFIALELVVHLVLWLRRCPNFYDRRG